MQFAVKASMETMKGEMVINNNKANWVALGVMTLGAFGARGQAADQLWLRYSQMEPAAVERQAPFLNRVFFPGQSPMIKNARNEWLVAVESLTGAQPTLAGEIGSEESVVAGTTETLATVLPPEFKAVVDELGPEGYVVKRMAVKNVMRTVICSSGERGLLYGVFGALRALQTGQALETIDLAESPAVELRLLNHWDNFDGSIERGYAGKSLWQWDELPGKVDQRVRDYARFCASLGINGTVLNNVNADPRILRPDFLAKVKALADVFRHWGITTYVSVNFASPLRPSETPNEWKKWGGVGDLSTADPLDPGVQAWWRKKTAEVYALIPDFGGFLVKADSEGMPGPKAYERNHAEGANMLAKALKPHGGYLIWRAFVYGRSRDRVNDLHNEFSKLDGLFDDNVILQIKNGPLDFQPREPVSTLFGAMPKTNLSIELQVTKEYLGHETTLCYLGPLWEEIMQSDTYAKGKGSIVAKVIDGTLSKPRVTCIAGVANTGRDADWCGSVFNQANWYLFGRLAWNPEMRSAAIADEWSRMTFNCSDDAHEKIQAIMGMSYEATVNYTMPLGLCILVDGRTHYKPKTRGREKYHHGAASGIGVDRTTSGSNHVAQYPEPLRSRYNKLETTPLKYLLWFHHVAWDKKLETGRTLLQELEHRYTLGVKTVDQMGKTWQSLKGEVDAERFKSVSNALQAEASYARGFRKHCLAYFRRLAK